MLFQETLSFAESRTVTSLQTQLFGAGTFILDNYTTLRGVLNLERFYISVKDNTLLSTAFCSLSLSRTRQLTHSFPKPANILTINRHTKIRFQPHSRTRTDTPISLQAIHCFGIENYSKGRGDEAL